MAKIFCPVDGSEMRNVGDEGIVGYDGNWDAQASKYRCADEKHIIFVVDAEAVFDPYDVALDAAYLAIDEALDGARWGTSQVYLSVDGKPQHEPLESLEDLRNELAQRAVFAFKDTVEEELDGGYNLDKVEYEYIHAMEDVDELLASDKFKLHLEALGWLKPK
jgi:hypothetical protein